MGDAGFGQDTSYCYLNMAVHCFHWAIFVGYAGKSATTSVTLNTDHQLCAKYEQGCAQG